MFELEVNEADPDIEDFDEHALENVNVRAKLGLEEVTKGRDEEGKLLTKDKTWKRVYDDCWNKTRLPISVRFQVNSECTVLISGERPQRQRKVERSVCSHARIGGQETYRGHVLSEIEQMAEWARTSRFEEDLHRPLKSTRIRLAMMRGVY